MVQHLRERERQQELAQMQIYCTAVTDLLRDAHLRAEQQGLQLQLPAGCASLADVPPAAGQLREVWLHARGSAPDPSVAAGTVLMLVSRLSVEQCRQLVPEASPGALRSVLSGSSCQPIVRHLQQHHGAQELADAASQEAVARDVARLQRTEQQMRQVLAAAGGLLEAAGAAPELLEAVPLLQPSEEYLRTCGRMGPLPGAPTVACALLQLTGMTRREAAAALGLPEGTGTTASKHIANPKFREWAEPPLLQLGAVPSPELEALRHWAGQEDVTTGTERLGSDEKQLSDWASCKARLKETGCRELARLVNGGHLTLLEARLVAVSLALLPLPADWDSFTGSGRSRLSVGSVVGAAVATALPGKFTEVDAASLFGTGRGNVGRHSALLRLLPLLVAQAVEQLAEEEPEQQSQGQLVAARLRKAAGILAKAGAAQSSADDFWWLLGIVGLLCDYLGKEVDAGRLSEEVAAAAAQRGAALKPHAGAAAAPRKKNGNAIVAALLLYALSLASRAGGGGAGASGSGAGASSSGAGAAACPGSSNGAGSSSAARNNAAASAPLPYTAMTKAAAACGCSNISGMVEHSKPTSALRWVYDQLGVQPPSKSEQTKNSWAARKAAKGTGKKQGRKAGGAVGGGKAKKSKKA